MLNLTFHTLYFINNINTAMYELDQRFLPAQTYLKAGNKDYFLSRKFNDLHGICEDLIFTQAETRAIPSSLLYLIYLLRLLYY